MTRPVRTGYCSRHKVAAVDGGCVYCDDENPIHKRYAIVEIAISELDLTDGGEMSVEESWTDLEDEISKAVRQPRHGRNRVPFQITFEEWEP